MAVEGTRFYMEITGTESGKKTISVANPQDSITMAQVNAFLAAFNAVYPTETFTLSTCYYQDVENRALSS